MSERAASLAGVILGALALRVDHPRPFHRLKGVRDDSRGNTRRGCGTFDVKLVIASGIPPQGRLLVLGNGAYGEARAKIAAYLRIDHRPLQSEEDTVPVTQQVESLLLEDPAITHVAWVHCETTTAIVNALEPIGQIVQRYH